MNTVKIFSELSRLCKNDGDRLCGLKTALIKYFSDCGFYFDVKKHLESFFSDFTINNIISAWAKEKIELINEAPFVLDGEVKNAVIGILNDDSFDLSHENTSFIGEIYQDIISASDRKAKGIAYTPELISEYMTDLIRGNVYKSNTMFDPACGCGVFLSGFYDAMLQRIATHESELEIEATHRDIIEKRIFASDISEEACAISKIVLALKYRRCVISKNIFCCDSLTQLPEAITERQFDFIMMNPPYVGHKKVSGEYMKRLKQTYSEVYYDKGDLSYCFFKLAGQLCADGGHVCAVTGRYFAQGLCAKGLRSYLLDNFIFRHVVDFYGQRPFKAVGVDPMILLLKKGEKPGNVFPAIKLTQKLSDNAFADYRDMTIYVKQSDLSSSGFNFLNEEQSSLVKRIEQAAAIRLGDAMNFFQGVITGCDNAFVVNSDSLLYENCLNECGVKWIKSKDIKKGKVDFKGEYLLYTQKADEAEIPYTMEKLRYYKNTLSKRREVVNRARKWYELSWGRRKYLFENEKLIFPYKSADNRFAADKSGYFFSADVYGAVAKKNFPVDVDKLALMLNTKLYENYFFKFSKKLGGELYEYYPNTVKNIMVPPADAINSFENEADVYKYFNMEKTDD